MFSQKIDTEPDEFYYNFGDYSGKFVFDQNKRIRTIPHSELIIQEYIENGQIKGFDVHAPDGKIYVFGKDESAIEVTENTNYILPNSFTYHEPNGSTSRKHFKAADLDEAQYPFQTAIMCLPTYYTHKNTYIYNYKVMEGPSYTSKWYLKEIISKISNRKVELEYENQEDISFYSSQSFDLNFPNFAESDLSNSIFKSRANDDDKYNPNNLGFDNPYVYPGGNATLTYTIVETNQSKPILKSINSLNSNEKYIFDYNLPNPELINSSLLTKISHLYGEILNRAWLFDFIEKTPSSPLPLSCSNDPETELAIAVPSETMYEFRDEITRANFFFGIKIFTLTAIKKTITIPFPFGYLLSLEHYPIDVLTLGERSSLYQIKAYENLYNKSIEEDRFNREHNRVFLKKIDLKDRDENIHPYVLLEYFNEEGICNIPRKFSTEQDLWGHYSGNQSDILLPSIQYYDSFGDFVDGQDGTKGSMHLGLLNSGNGNQVTTHNSEANLEKNKIGALKKIDFYNGLSYQYNYSLHEYQPEKFGAGLRVSHFVTNNGNGSIQSVWFEYKNPVIVNMPARRVQHSLNFTTFREFTNNKETYITHATSSQGEWHKNKAHYVGYSRVIRNFQNNGKIDTHFTNYKDKDLNPNYFNHPFRQPMMALEREDKWAFPIINIDANTRNNDYSMNAPNPFAFSIIPDWRLGLPKEISIFDQHNNLKQSETYSYSYPQAEFFEDCEFPILTINDTDPHFRNSNENDSLLSIDCEDFIFPEIIGIKKTNFTQHYPGNWVENFNMRLFVQFLPFKSSLVRKIISNLLKLKDFIISYKYIRRNLLYIPYSYLFEQVLLESKETKIYENGSLVSNIYDNYNYDKMYANIDPAEYSINSVHRPYFYRLKKQESVYKGLNKDQTSKLIEFFYHTEVKFLPQSVEVLRFNNIENDIDYFSLRYNYNKPFGQKEFINNNLVSGEFNFHKLINANGSNGAIVKSRFWEIVNGNFVYRYRIFDWDTRGNPINFKKTKFKVSDHPLHYSFFPAINLTWNSDDKLLSRSVHDGNGNSFNISYTYNNFKELSSITDENGIISSFYYDALGRLKEANRQNGLSTDIYAYSYKPNIITTRSSFFDNTPVQIVSQHFDGLQNLLKVERKDGASLESNSYDNMFRLSSKSTLGGGTTHFTYEPSPIGRISESRDAENNIFKYGYYGPPSDPNVPTAFASTETKNPNDNNQIEVVDGLGRVLMTESGEGGKTYYDYNNYGQLSQVTNPEDQIYEYTYNKLGKLNSKLVPNSALESYLYNDRQQIISRNDGVNSFLLEYDDFGRTKGEFIFEGSINWTPNGDDVVANPDYSSATTSKDIIYETDLNRILETKEMIFDENQLSSNFIETINSYDGFNRVTSQSINLAGSSHTIIFDLNGAGSPNSITKTLFGTTVEEIFKYDAVLRPEEKLIKPSPSADPLIVHKNIYNSKDQIITKLLGQVEATGSNSFLQKIDYKYDKIGRLFQINDLLDNECTRDDLFCDLELSIEVPNFFDPANNPCYLIEKVQINNVVYDLPIPFQLFENNFRGLKSKIENIIDYFGFHGEVTIEAMNGNNSKELIINILNSNIYSLIFISSDSNPCHHNFDSECCDHIPDWITSGNSPTPSDNPDLFYQKLTFDGLNISQIEYYNGCVPGKIKNTYIYDSDHRLKETNNFMYTPTRVKDNYSSHYEYDKAGNLKHLTRYGFTGLDASQDPTYGLIDQLTYLYDQDYYLGVVSNDLNVASDEYGFKGGGSGYLYDLKGNMTNSTLNGLNIVYNHINLPGVVDSDFGSQKVHYSLGGSKMLTVNTFSNPPAGHPTDLTRMYFMGLELEYEGIGSFSSTFTPKSYHFGDGQLLFDGTDIRKQYHLHDHLGNVVVAFEDKDNDGELIQTTDPATNEVPHRYHYYSYGMQWDLPDPLIPDYSDDNRYEYNGKEYERVAQLLDYGWRWYDPVIGRWGGVDPLAERAPAWTPYRYGFNNPILFTDPDGLFESRGDAKEYRSNETDYTRRNSRIRKNNEGTYDIRVKGGDSNSAIRINRNSGGDITYSASARSFTADRLSNFFSWLSDFFKEGERQQSTAGENWDLYGDGSPSGWEIPAPHANPDGENRSIEDIPDMFPSGGGVNDLGEGILNPIRGLNRFDDVVNSLKDRLNPRGGSREAVDSLCNTCAGRPHGAWPYRRIDASGDVIDTTRNRN